MREMCDNICVGERGKYREVILRSLEFKPESEKLMLESFYKERITNYGTIYIGRIRQVN